MVDFIKYGIPAYFQSMAHTLRNREEGQALVEYALILALISVVAVAVLTDIGTNVTNKLGDVRDALA